MFHLKIHRVSFSNLMNMDNKRNINFFFSDKADFVTHIRSKIQPGILSSVVLHYRTIEKSVCPANKKLETFTALIVTSQVP